MRQQRRLPMKADGAWAWRSRTKCWRTSSVAGARGLLLSPRSIPARSASVRHNASCQTGCHVGRQHRSPGLTSCLALAGGGQDGRRWRAAAGAPEGRGRERSEGTGHAQRQGSEGAASPAPERPQPRGAQRPAYLGRRRDRSAGRYRPASERDREPPAPSPNRPQGP